MAVMIVDDNNASIRMTVDTASSARLAFERKPVLSQRAYEFSYGGITEKVDKFSGATHKLTGTTGVPTVCMAFSMGTFCPFSSMTST